MTDSAPLGARATGYLDVIRAYRERCRVLADDLAFMKDGGNIYYACDFRELFTFAYGKYGTTPQLSNASADERAQTRAHYRLGLTHLINSVATPLYLLRPYADELIGHLRSLDRTRAHFTRAYEEARIAQDQIAREFRDFDLRNALSAGEPASEVGGDSDVATEEERAVINFIRLRFSSLCTSLDKLSSAQAGVDAQAKLNSLWTSRKLALWDVPGRGALAEAERVIEQECPTVLQAFPSGVRTMFRAAKYRDAEALLYVREANRYFETERINARLVLISTDNSLRQAAHELGKDKDFAWPAVRRHVRSAQSLFIDLLTQHSEHLPDRIARLEEISSVLDRFATSINHTLAAAPHDGAEHERQEQCLASVWLQLQNQQNLWLSMACTRVPWLADRLKLADEDVGVLWAGHQTERQILTALAHFIFDARFRQLAEVSTDATYTNILSARLKLAFLSVMDEAARERVVSVIAPDRNAVSEVEFLLRRSDKYGFLYSINLLDPEYATLLRWMREVRVGNALQSSAGLIRDALQRSISHALFTRNDPEAFLLMSAVLWTVGQHTQAIACANQALRLTDAASNRTAEVNYLLAMMHRQIAQTHQDGLAASHLELAQSAIDTALRADPTHGKDPRLLLESALIQLELEDESDAVGRADRSERGMSPLDSLLEAYANVGSDTYLRFRVLNNLVYFASIRNVDLSQFDPFVHELLGLVGEQSSSARREHLLWPTIRHTLLIHRIRRAVSAGDDEAIWRALESLEGLTRNADLDGRLAKLILRQSASIRSWMESTDRYESSIISVLRGSA